MVPVIVTLPVGNCSPGSGVGGGGPSSPGVLSVCAGRPARSPSGAVAAGSVGAFVSAWPAPASVTARSACRAAVCSLACTRGSSRRVPNCVDCQSNGCPSNSIASNACASASAAPPVAATPGGPTRVPVEATRICHPAWSCPTTNAPPGVSCGLSNCPAASRACPAVWPDKGSAPARQCSRTCSTKVNRAAPPTPVGWAPGRSGSEPAGSASAVVAPASGPLGVQSGS
jgi:hypothetical protein